MHSSTLSLANRKPALNLKAGEWVIVRSQEEILTTLDVNGRLDNLPFQPEMLAFCGKRLRVAKSAHKTCDSINKTGGRKMSRAVHLEGGRCNGEMHGGCQADCVFFWKDDWLRRDGSQNVPEVDISSICTAEDLIDKVRIQPENSDNEPVWVCQTTSLYEATTLLKWWDLRQYIQDITSGNHSIWFMFKLLTAAIYRYIVQLGYGYRFLVGFYNSFQKIRGGQPYPACEGQIPVGKPTPNEILNLQPGEWVEVKQPEEIKSTINASGFNRGMRFDMELLKYSGKRYRVEMRVDKIINEQTGKMLVMKSPCIQLEDVYCRAECTPMRLGCPRASNTYWREIWLKRVGPKA